MAAEKLLKPGALLNKLLNTAVSGSNVLPLTGFCNMSCIFCSHQHNPPGIHAYSFQPLPAEQIMHLLECLDPGRKIIIGESATRLREGEPLTHPHIIPILESLRKRYPSTLIQVTTNGSLLTEALMDKLAALQPLELVISLNSATRAIRARLMSDRRFAQTLEAVTSLSALGIPFHGSVVGLPHLVGWNDIEKTARFLQNCGALSIRYLVAGFSRYFSPELLPPANWRQESQKRLQYLKETLRIPLFIDPPLIDNLEPIISGVIPGSPAAEAGFKAGDLIKTVDGKVPFSRVEAYNLVKVSENPRLDILRREAVTCLSIIKRAGQSPGLAFDFDLDPDQVERVRSALSPVGQTLMLVSAPAYERWKTAVTACRLDNLSVEPVTSRYFGGTIDAAGLLTVGDFALTLEKIPAWKSFTMILFPAIAFDQTGTDLAGHSFLSLKESGPRVKLIN